MAILILGSQTVNDKVHCQEGNSPGLVQSGDDIVIVAGVPLGEAVRTNTMRIRTVR